MIIDSETLPPPPYFPPSLMPTLPTLPLHLLLHIIYLTFPQSSLLDAPKLERQRKTLYWLATSLCLVNRTLYMSCMHVLRSTYMPAYDALVRPPYTSNPFPLLLSPAPVPTHISPYSTLTSALSPPISSLQCKTFILDRFIALKVREDIWADESKLHLECNEVYKDLFDHDQPRMRLEDLVRLYEIQKGVVCVDLPPGGSSATASIPIANLTITFSLHSATLILHPTQCTIVSTPCAHDESLEDIAMRLVGLLEGWAREGGKGD